MVARGAQEKIQLGSAFAGTREETALAARSIAFHLRPRALAPALTTNIRSSHGTHRPMRLSQARGRRPRLSRLPGRARQAHLRQRQQGSLRGLEEAPDDARQRESTEPRRCAGPPISGAPNGKLLLRQRRRTTRRLRAAGALNETFLILRRLSLQMWEIFFG